MSGRLATSNKFWPHPGRERMHRVPLWQRPGQACPSGPRAKRPLTGEGQVSRGWTFCTRVGKGRIGMCKHDSLSGPTTDGITWHAHRDGCKMSACSALGRPQSVSCWLISTTATAKFQRKESASGARRAQGPKSMSRLTRCRVDHFEHATKVEGPASVCFKLPALCKFSRPIQR